MAEFYFHVIEEDCLDVLADIQQLGRHSIFADREYSTEVPHDIGRLSPAEVLTKLPNRRLFLAGPSVAALPRLRRTERGSFFIYQDHIPDLISLSLGRVTRVDSYTRLGISSVDYSRSYHTPEGQPIPPTEDLKRDYADVVKIIRRRCKRVRIDHYLWVGRHALDLPDPSRVLLIDRGKLFDLDGFFVMSNLPAGSVGAKQHEEEYRKRKRTQRVGAANAAPAHR